MVFTWTLKHSRKENRRSISGRKCFKPKKNVYPAHEQWVFQKQERLYIEILPTAWEDLKVIEDWYLIQFDVDTSLKVSNHILDAIERLSDFPDSGSMTPDKWLNKQGYRMVICGKHVAIYRVIKETVYIYHIADTQTEYTKLFY